VLAEPKIQTEDCDNSTFFCNNINTLEQNSEDEQSSHLSEYECGIALREMKNNKSPGTADFYKIFWNDIKQYLMKSLNYSYDKNPYRTSKTKYYYASTKERQRYIINKQLETNIFT